MKYLIIIIAFFRWKIALVLLIIYLIYRAAKWLLTPEPPKPIEIRDYSHFRTPNCFELITGNGGKSTKHFDPAVNSWRRQQRRNRK